MKPKATTRPLLGHDTARHPATRSRARAQHDAQCAWLRAGSRYKNCIVAKRGRRWCRDTTQQGATRPMTRQLCTTTRPASHAIQPATRRHCELRHDAVRANEALCARPGCSVRSLGSPCEQPGSVGCAPVHPT